ncbi:MAG: PcfJ domain-containing protein [Roseburia sp.]|nr:PcfJ domain-containing protein [Roseburia sp.]
MKKKAIEKIPYLTLKKTSRKKDVKYIGVTAVKIVGHEKHLFLEVYQNEKTAKAVPVVRIVLTKKDFGTYFPESGTWTRQQIYGEYALKLIWEQESEARDTWNQMTKRNILCEKEDLERIRNITGESIYNQDRWWEYIQIKQQRILSIERRKAEQRRYERRNKALKERIDNTRELPEEKILENADAMFFHNKHYLYYKKHGCFATIACSKCGGVTDARWKSGISYESQFQRWTDEPREGHYGNCPLCGAQGEYKCQGKVKGAHSKSIHLFLGQKYKENGFVLRYIDIQKKWQLELIATDSGVEMHSAREELSGIEIARAYFEPGKKTQIDYHKHNPYIGQDFWDDCNLSGLANISIDTGWVMGETYKELEGTMFQYSALKEYAEEKDVNPISYLERYMETPQLEMLVKLGLSKIADELVSHRDRMVKNKNAKCPDKFLGIRKARVKQLIEKQGDLEYLEAMQIECRMQQVWTDEQIEEVAETGLKRGQIETVTKYMSLQQLLNRIKKYSGCEYGTGCAQAKERIRAVKTIYIDYLNMREALGYDLHNTVYQQPRNLEQAHAKMVQEGSKEGIDKRIMEVKLKFGSIQENYRALRNKYYYEDDTYIIRPARSAEEIVMEGRILHHCVGGDNYLRKHNDGESYILMLRFRKEAEIPYITVEIDASTQKILQWYGAHDKKPDQEHMQQWLNKYIMKLKLGTLHEPTQIGQTA